MSPATVPRGTAFVYSGPLEGPVKEVILTPEGHKKLKEEIEFLSTVKRREVAERIKQAREFGDITENSEYDDAKNEQAMLEHRIATLEERLTSARVVNKREIPTGVVAVGTKVRLRDIDANETAEYHIVGSAEAESRRAQAFERVARRQGDHGAQEGRDRRGRRPARLLEVQDHGNQSRLAARRAAAEPSRAGSGPAHASSLLGAPSP